MNIVQYSGTFVTEKTPNVISNIYNFLLRDILFYL